LAERGEPVLAAPLGGVGRVNGDHSQALVMGHLGEPVPEPGGLEGACELAEGPATPPA
jgi:hypothetical protein